jgi:flagellar basal body P-ring protein FlgI
MWRSIPGETWVFRALVLALVLAQIQADAAPPRKKKTEPPPLKVEETVGDLAYVLQGSEVKVMGIGLVAGLENTGADPPPSWERGQLVDEMSKAGVEHANKLLSNPQFSMVIVKMTIRAGADPQDRFDVDVEVPPACSTRSLAGGYLMATRLRETLVAGGAPRTGSDLAFAQGPVMTGNAKNPNDPKVGRVLGGGRVKKESPYMLIIKDKRKSVRTAAILEKVVNERFHQSDAGEQKGACTAKTDGYLVLRVPPSYHQNQERFFRVIQLLPMVDTPALRAQRMAAWGKELLEPKTSGVAALKLEGLGPTASETLQAALKSPNDQVRFFAAEALAYLDDPVGSETLAETAIHMPKFRAYALAALASMDQNAAHMKLRNLMSEPDTELRYGAFNALRTLDPHDPSLGQVRVLDDPRTEEQQDEAPDSMALALASAAQRPRAEDPFALYIVDSEGPPVIHVSRTRRSEIVVFGRSQKLLPPIVLGTGAILLNAAEKDDEIEISKIVPSKFGDSDVKLRTSLELAEVIRRVANLGTTYPEMVAILDAANRQKNLPGALVVDAVPVSNMDYLQAAILGKDAKAKVDPAVQRAYQRSQSRFWRLFGARDRDMAATSSTKSDSIQKASSSSSATPSTVQNPGSAPSAVTAQAPSTETVQATTTSAKTVPAAADAASGTTTQSVPKKDDGIQRASGDDQTETPPRSRLLDWLRRRFDGSSS